MKAISEKYTTVYMTGKRITCNRQSGAMLKSGRYAKFSRKNLTLTVDSRYSDSSLKAQRERDL